jgi:hypothetical protein
MKFDHQEREFHMSSPENAIVQELPAGKHPPALTPEQPFGSPAEKDHKAVLDYGKKGDVSWLPTQDDLLRQLKKDDLPKINGLEAEVKDHPEDRTRLGPQARLDMLKQTMGLRSDDIKSLSEEDLKNVGEFAQALHNNDWQAAEAVIKRYHDNPMQLEKLYTPIQLELERAKMSNEWQLAGANIGPKGAKYDLQRVDPSSGEYSHYGFSTNETSP